MTHVKRNHCLIKHWVKKCRFPLENIPIYHFIFKSRSKNCGVEIVTNALFKASTKVKLCVRGIP